MSSYSVHVITDIDQAMMLEAKWRVLTEQHSDDLQCFMSWEWLSQWLISYQDYVGELKILCVMDNDLCIAIAPFYTSTHQAFGLKLTTLAFIATNEPEYCEVASEFIDIAYLPSHKEIVIELIATRLCALTNIHQYHFKDINKNSLIYAVCQQLKPAILSYSAQVSGYQFHLNLDDKPDYPAAFAKKRKRILNRFTNFKSTTNSQFVVADNKALALKLFAHLIQLHQQRWLQKSKSGVFADSHFSDFHRLFIENNFEKGIIVISAIQVEQQIIAVNYAIRWHNTLYFYQSGIDDSYKPNLSPGLLNHLLLIDYCENNRIQQYNLLKSANIDDYKSQFSQLGDELIDITMLSSKKLNLFRLAINHFKHGLKHLIKRVN